MLPLFDGPISSCLVNYIFMSVSWDYSKSLDDRDQGMFIFINMDNNIFIYMRFLGELDKTIHLKHLA